MYSVGALSRRRQRLSTHILPMCVVKGWDCSNDTVFCQVNKKDCGAKQLRKAEQGLIMKLNELHILKYPRLKLKLKISLATPWILDCVSCLVLYSSTCPVQIQRMAIQSCAWRAALWQWHSNLCWHLTEEINSTTAAGAGPMRNLMPCTRSEKRMTAMGLNLDFGLSVYKTCCTWTPCSMRRFENFQQRCIRSQHSSSMLRGPTIRGPSKTCITKLSWLRGCRSCL